MWYAEREREDRGQFCALVSGRSRKEERMSSEGRMLSPSELSHFPASSMLSSRFRSDCTEKLRIVTEVRLLFEAHLSQLQQELLRGNVF